MQQAAGQACFRPTRIAVLGGVPFMHRGANEDDAMAVWFPAGDSTCMAEDVHIVVSPLAWPAIRYPSN